MDEGSGSEADDTRTGTHVDDRTGAGTGTGTGTDAHTALVGSRGGRILVGLLVVVLVVWIVGPNMPGGPFRDRVDGLWRPAEEIGLQQDWAVFSPNPRSQSLDVLARIVHDDGSIDTWNTPSFDPLVGALREYRWQKWQERVRLDARSDLWDSTALWIADRYRRDGELPQRVVLVRRWIDHLPLDDTGTPDGDWNEFEFHVWERDR